MKIGNLILKGDVFLAPMVGFTDLPFRLLCKEQGAALIYTEMINAKALCYKNKNTICMLQVDPQEEDVGVQIFGSDPDFMGEAAKILCDLNRFSLIDINMGCPVPKVVKGNDGSALMKNPSLAAEIIRKVKKNSTIPVTVKFRKGWDENSVNAVEFAVLMQEAGADAVAIHGRTRSQFYSGKADWNIIKSVAQAVTIPVIGNGDVFTPADAKRMFEETGVEGIMIARGSKGNPFIFKMINEYRKTGILLPDVTEKERIQTLKRHYAMVIAIHGENVAIKEMRKQCVCYVKGLRGSARLKNTIMGIENWEDIRQVLDEYEKTLTSQ